MKRQGDLLILEIQDIPQSAKSCESRVLAEGEKTGHLHELDRGNVYSEKDQLYFHIPEEGEALLTHPEHQTIVFPPGKYKVIRQREYQPGSWRYVQD